MARQLDEYQLLERSIIKKFRKNIWNPFIQGVKDYSLISEGDRIGVMLEDSAEALLCAKLMQQLQRISEVEFNLTFTSERDAVKLAEKMNIPLSDSLEFCNKTVNFTCFDDVVESTLMWVMHGHKIQTIIPSEGHIIRPMYCIERDSIYSFARYNSLDYSYNAPSDEALLQAQSLLKELKAKGENIENSVFKSTQAVCLDTLLGYQKNGEYHSFLEKY